MLETLTPLVPDQHNRLRYEAKADYSFAKDIHISPLLLSEVSKAARDYPVVFPSGKGVIVPQQLLSIIPNRNYSVAEDGTWIGGYTPRHLRRYPFFLGRDKKLETAILMFAEGAPQLGDEGKLLYNKRGKKFVASHVLKQIKSGLISYDEEYQATRALGALLQAAGVLEEGRLTGTIDGKEQTVRGFSVVNWKKVVKLDDVTLANWARIGLIQLINTHLQSIKDHFQFSPKTEKSV
jgi:hypothetical protein